MGILSTERPDIPLIILRLSLSAVKGNLNHGSRDGPMGGPEWLTHRSMEARGCEITGTG